MASVVISGDTSGAITLQSPAVAGTNTVNFGANTGTAILDANTPAFRNRIINGAMVIDARNAGASVSIASGAAAYPVDRFYVQNITDGAFTAEQVEDTPAGFYQSLKVTVTTADASLGSTQYSRVLQFIEGTNVADFGMGAAGASTFTLSFWVKSSLTGAFGGACGNASDNRMYPFTYTISAANTWEQKSVTIVGDTTGTWGKANGIGLSVMLGLGVGATYSGTAGSWAGTTYLSATGATSVVGTSGATFYITGVQLEKGSTATSFDYRPYGTELALCQRYYYKVGPSLGNDANIAFNGFAGTTTIALLTVPFPVTMRTSPSALEQSGTAADYAVRYAGASIANCSAVPTFQSGQTFGAQIGLTVASGLTAGGTIGGRTGSATGNNSYLAWSAEL